MAETFTGVVTKAVVIVTTHGPGWRGVPGRMLRTELRTKAGNAILFHSPTVAFGGGNNWINPNGTSRIAAGDTITVRGTVTARNGATTHLNRVKLITSPPPAPPPPASDPISDAVRLYEAAVQRGSGPDALRDALAARDTLLHLRDQIHSHLAILEDHVAYLQTRRDPVA